MESNNKKKLDLLLKLGCELFYNMEPHRLFEKINNLGVELLEADRCSIFVLDDDKHELWTKTAHKVDEIRMRDDEGIVGEVATSGEIIHIKDAYNDPRFNDDIDRITGYKTTTILALPLKNRDEEVMGVFQALNSRNGEFSQTDVDLGILLSEYISSSLENQILTNRVIDGQTKLIYKLSMAGEFKDEETGFHTKRVAYYSTVIGRAYGLNEEQVDMLALLAPMHDIGKIGISDALLHKHGKLTDEEMDKMREHASIGYELLNDDDDKILQTAATIACDHHERWDGSGYPNGTAGEQISVYGRIVAIADVFDALTSTRPYKKAWSFEDAFAHIRNNRGVHFDPRMVDLFGELEYEIRHIYDTYRDN